MWDTETTTASSSGLSAKLVIFIILLVIILNILLICACKLYMKRKMNTQIEADNIDDKISSAVTSYMALKDKH